MHMRGMVGANAAQMGKARLPGLLFPGYAPHKPALVPDTAIDDRDITTAIYRLDEEMLSVEEDTSTTVVQ